MNRSLLKRALGLGVALGALLSGPWAVAAEGIGGAGSSAAAPVFRIWAQEYRKAGGDALEDDPVGSGTGLARIKQRNTDFGAVDVMVPKNELARDGLVMFPTAVSGVVPVVNLRRLGGALKLNGEVLARIFLGEITVWNAAEIAALNPGLALPKDPIRVVCRSDVSGTTHHLADYLSKVSPAWKARFGVVGRPVWPAGFTAVKGSSEVSQAVRNTPGAIGYIDYSYVVEDALTPVQLAAANGRYVAASPVSFRNAVVSSRWFTHGDFSESLTQMPGDGAWPITMGTYAVVPKVAAEPERAVRTLRFFMWAYGHGDALARHAKFAALPEKVQASAFRELSSVTGRNGEPLGMNALVR